MLQDLKYPQREVLTFGRVEDNSQSAEQLELASKQYVLTPEVDE